MFVDQPLASPGSANNTVKTNVMTNVIVFKSNRRKEARAYVVLCLLVARWRGVCLLSPGMITKNLAADGAPL